VTIGADPVKEFQDTVWSSLKAATQLPVEEHARRAHHAGGPPIDELERRIREHRGEKGAT